MLVCMKALILTVALLSTLPAAAQQPVVWRFDNLTSIGGAHVTTLGSPAVVDTNLGKAIHFEGHGASSNKPETGNPTGDALFIDQAPLAGATTYTFEVIFRPSSQGAPAQRFFHMQETGSQSRRMFELRIVDHQWCLDSVAIDAPASGGPQAGAAAHRAITLNCDAAHLHPLDQWYAVTATWDGTTIRGYINGQLQGEAAGTLSPLGPGTTSVGTRMDKRDFFTGDVFSARFTPRVLSADHFLTVPTKP